MSTGGTRQKLLTLAIVAALVGVAFWSLLLLVRFASPAAPDPQPPAPALQRPDDPPEPAAESAQAATPRPQLGINLSGLSDWNTELPFLDVFKLSRPWISQKNDAPWGSGPALALDPRGWVTHLEPGCYVETLLCSIDEGHYPAGAYTLLYEGEGELELSGSASISGREPGKLTLDVQPSKGYVYLKIRSTKPNNYVRNIRLLLPGGLPENPWNPSFLKRWEGIACIRFMDWMNTNGSKVRTWNERAKIDDATYAVKGAPIEAMIDLCNRLKADAWVCMPHLADDDYVRRFALLAKEKLDKKRKIYVEYSNEVWNSGFEQNQYSIEEGKRQGLSPSNQWEGGWKFTGMRSTQVFKVWTDVFGGTSIAPYLNFTVGPEARGDEPGAKTVTAWTVAQVLDHVEKVCLPQSVAWIRAQKKLASERGLRLVAYEAGQHLVGILGAENDDKLTQLLHSANNHPRMKDIYARYLDAWAKEGGDLLCHYNSVGRWDKWGSWGLLKSGDEDPLQSPKFSATMRWAQSLGQPVKAPK